MSVLQLRRKGARRFRPDRDVEEWHGRYVPYDIIKEFVAAFLVVLLITLGLAIVLSSPDVPPVTLKSWSLRAPLDFAQTAVTELAGTSPTATYGPPYNSTPGVSQTIGPVSLESLLGVHHPINTALDDVIDPLRTLPSDPALASAIRRYTAATAKAQTGWTDAYGSALVHARFAAGKLVTRPGDYGPVAEMIGALTTMARSGALDGALVSSKQFYGTDYTKPLLFLADGTYLANLAAAQHLHGTQWGMMNETGNFPGQSWLWLYTFWYQIPPFTTSTNADALVWAIMVVLTVLLALVPFLPGVRSIPRKVRIYRLIWRRHYRSLAGGAGGAV
ncbi:MAG: hypothetical protein ABSA31_09535 [Acidimicrobiales bacterium]